MDPPSYAETTFMADRFFGFPETIKLEGETVSQEQGIYSIYIRDTSGCLLVKADLNTEYGAVRFTNSSGINYLEVISTSVGNGERSFKVFHYDMQIGLGEIKNPLTFNLCNTYENRTYYKVHSLRIGDIAVLRDTYAPPICNMHLPGSASSSSYGFDGVITFPEGNSITKVEQCLCVSLAVVFAIEQNRARIAIATATSSEGSESNSSLTCCLACMCLIVVGFIIFLGIAGLDSYACNKKKREGWAGYRNRDC